MNIITQNVKINTSLIFTFCVMMFILAACAGGNFGRLKLNYEVTRQFETFQVEPDYRYYYNGPDGRPRAVIGLHKDYELVTDYWHEIPMDPRQMRSFVESMTWDDNQSLTFFGFYILASDNRRLGIWFSMQKDTVVKLGPNNTVEIYPPDSRIEKMSWRLNNNRSKK